MRKRKKTRSRNLWNFFYCFRLAWCVLWYSWTEGRAIASRVARIFVPRRRPRQIDSRPSVTLPVHRLTSTLDRAAAPSTPCPANVQSVHGDSHFHHINFTYTWQTLFSHALPQPLGTAFMDSWSFQFALWYLKFIYVGEERPAVHSHTQCMTRRNHLFSDSQLKRRPQQEQL